MIRNSRDNMYIQKDGRRGRIMNIAVCTKNPKIRKMVRDQKDIMIFYIDRLDDLQEQEFDLALIDIALCKGKLSVTKYQSARTVFLLLDITEESINEVIASFYVGVIPFTYSFNGLEYTIDLNDIVYFESEHREIKGYYENGEYIRFYDKLDNVESMVDDTVMFLRINKSCLVNYNYCKIQKDNVDVMDQQMHISRTYKKSVQERLNIIKSM